MARFTEPVLGIPQPVRCQVMLMTPVGRGAVASLQVSGLNAIDVVSRFFRSASHRDLRHSLAGHLHFGQWFSPFDDQVEELVVQVNNAQQLEVHCHGGRWATERLLRCLRSAGCEVISWDSAPAGDSNDVLAHEAWLALVQARTLRAASILLDQFGGALRREVQAIADSAPTSSPNQIRQELGRLINRGRLGSHLTQPWIVVLTGAPNVGKSTLLNRLLGYERAIVHETPGTTRDVLSETTALDGWLVSIRDTAGIRHTTDSTEQAGVARAYVEINSADLLLRVRDARESEDNPGTIADSTQRQIVVWNKCDLSVRKETAREQACVSALTGWGIPELIEKMIEYLVGVCPAPGAAVPFLERHQRLLGEADELAKSGRMTEVRRTLLQIIRPT